MANILIVDDSIVMRKNLATILRANGHTIAGEASNGRQAIAQYEALIPDIVTMDISMPIMSGVEAVEGIIEKFPDARIIVISAVNQKKMVYNAINSGASHYIIKPIDTQKVISVVNEVLSGDWKDEEQNKNGQSPSNTEEETQGFEINNEDGRFTIRFNKSLNGADHNLLNMAIRGILFIKPLIVVFNFEGVEEVEQGLLDPILKLGEEIKVNGGEVFYKAKNEKLVAKLPMDELSGMD